VKFTIDTFLVLKMACNLVVIKSMSLAFWEIRWILLNLGVGLENVALQHFI